jgi:chaperonin GroES
MLQKLNKRVTINKDLIQAPNLTDRFTEEDLDTIGTWVWMGYDADEKSRVRWRARTNAAMNLAMQVQQDKNFPWAGCSNVVFPLVTIAALQFSSRSYGNIIQGTDVVKYRITGPDPDEKLKAQADRISKHMSWQVLEDDCSWEEQHDRLLINLGIVGCNFIKTYFSPRLQHNVSELVMARDMVLDYWAKSVEDAARKTQVVPMYRNEIYERVTAETFRKVLDEAWFNQIPAAPTPTTGVDNRQGVQPPPPDQDTPFRTLEQHRLMDLDQDGYAEPYIVTIEEQSKCVLRIVARFEREEDIDRTASGKILRIHSTEYFTKYGFIPAPDGGIYDVGFGTLLGPLNESVNSGINQLLDAGTMSNSNGGFLGRGAKIRGGTYTMAPFEWKRVDSTGDDLRKSMVPFPVNAPSDVMFKLLGLLIEYTDRIAGTTDPMVGENPGQNTPAETSRNTMEQGMKVYSGIFKRVWRSMKEEFKKLHKLNAMYLPAVQRFGNQGTYVNREDYKSNPDLVVPVADPNIVSDSQRVAQATAILTAAREIPGFSVPDSVKNWLSAMKVDAIDKYYPGPDKVPPLPNPKMQVEQGKIQIKQAELEFKKMQLVQTLQETRKLNQAKINQLNAQTVKLLAEVQTDQVRLKIESFESIVDALKTHNDAINNTIGTLSGLGEQNGSKGGGVSGVDAESGDAGGAGVPAPKSNGAAAPMGQ